jgi:predicted enzyme related to lactoylglutathione lyase
VVWHLLSAQDEALAFAVYAELFGWTSLEALDLGPERGRHVTFTSGGSTQAVGSISNLARLPHVHPQWLFFFATENLDESLARVRKGGGLTLGAAVTADGRLVAPCDDPQGAAFGLYQVSVR